MDEYAVEYETDKPHLSKARFLNEEEAYNHSRWIARFYDVKSTKVVKLESGWKTCAGAKNQLLGKTCAICGHLTHEREVVYNETNKEIDKGN